MGRVRSLPNDGDRNVRYAELPIHHRRQHGRPDNALSGIVTVNEFVSREHAEHTGDDAGGKQERRKIERRRIRQ